MRSSSIAVCVAATIIAIAVAAQIPTPVAKTVELDAHGRDYLPVLSGSPETAGMRSGLVVLAPQKSVGRHSTGEHEEILIVLEGKGQMIFGDSSTLPVEANHAVYCPPRTVHDVRNTGQGTLRYVYVVAKVS